MELLPHIQPVRPISSPAIEQAQHSLQQKLDQFRSQLLKFQNEKKAFEEQQLAAVHAHTSPGWEAERTSLKRELGRREHLLEEHAVEIEHQKAELTAARQELADLRRQFFEHYQDRRDRQALMQEELEKTRIELDEREKKLRFDEQEFAERRQRDRAQHEAIERRENELTQRTLKLEQERRAFEDRLKQSEADTDAKLGDLILREKKLADRVSELESKTKQYEADVLRLNRLQGELESQRTEHATDAAAIAKQRDELREDSAELAEQVAKLDAWRTELTEEAERLGKQKQEQDAQNRDLVERTAAVEGQQATLTILRGRLERMREDVRKREEQLDGERERLRVLEEDLTSKEEGLKQLEAEMCAEQDNRAREQKQWAERGAAMEAAVRQMKIAQEKINADRLLLEQQAKDLETGRSQLAETESLLHSRMSQLAETRDRLDLERNSLQQRSVNLLEREEAGAAFQEQLRKRSEEIDARHAEIERLVGEMEERGAAIEAKSAEITEREQSLKTQLETWRTELETKAQTLQQKHSEIAGFEDRFQEQMNLVSVQRQAHAREREEFQAEQRQALEDLAKSRAEYDAIRAEAQSLVENLPEAESRAGAVAERLGLAREQLRNHLGEIHQYVRQCQDDLTQLRGKLQNDLEELQTHEQSLRQRHDEHRLALAAFKQHLVEWQGQIAELRRSLARGENRLERKQAQVHEQARVINAESQRLAQHAEELQQQERDVADRREEIDRHLVDMREWYRRKLRDLAGIPLVPGEAPKLDEPAILPVPAATESADEDGEPGIIPTGRSILALKPPGEHGDDRLGRLMRDAQLIDGDTLTALLAEARRQRRSLRQVLLASGVITLYQLALIETGNLAGLMLGPVRVIDRLRTSPHETAYRVFDPRRGVEAVLRHLSEGDLADPLKPEDFRKHFRQAMLNDPHVGNTLDVFELAGRPAVLQEWLTGLTAVDWPPLAAAPGVCWRLLTQAAQGLAAGHRAGLVHGHLSEDSLLLTGEGVLKIRGLGEPAWLVGSQTDDEPSMREDLRALGRIASSWCTPAGVRKGPKTKPLPDALVSVLFRLAADGDQGYRDVNELLADLNSAADAIPPNAEAWDRLLKYIREHGASESPLRRSA